MKAPPFRYADPRSVEQALALLAEHGDEAKVLAGGQSLMPLLHFRLARPGVLVDVNRIDALAGLREEDGQLRVGATTRQHLLERWAAARPEWGLLAQALGVVGHGAIRTRGTVGGNLAHADPASELPAILACLYGSVVAHGPGGEREIRADDLFLGLLTTALGPDELLTEVRFPRLPTQAGWGFQEVARRHGDYALAGAAAVLIQGPDGRLSDCRIALFGVGETPLRAREAEQHLLGRAPSLEAIGEAARLATAPLDPPSDLQATAAYRRSVAGVLVGRALAQAVGRCGEVAA